MTPRRPSPDDPGSRPLDAAEIKELREGIEARQYWRRTRDILYNVSIWSAAVIAAVLLLRDQVIDLLRIIGKFVGTTP